MSTRWVPTVQGIQDGEDVKALVANRPIQNLTDRTDYLKALIDGIEAGQVIVLRNVPVASTVYVSYAVYWDVSNLRYAPAMAAVRFDDSLGGFTLAESAYVVGVCVNKSSNTVGDVALLGLLEVDMTLSSGVSGSNPEDAGAYYLSASQAGKITKVKPPAGVLVCYMRGDGNVHINPSPREFLESHIHYAVDLYAQPAGTLETPVQNTPYAFATVDNTLPGWLPASDPIFNGLAPTGAVYGYNLSAHPELSKLWPPLPLNNAYLEVFGTGVSSDLWSLDVNGLWWYSDCYGKGPWATTPASSSSSSSLLSSSSSSSSSSTPTCDSGPTLAQMGFTYNAPTSKWMRLYLAKMVYKTNSAVVTSLRPATGSPITVTGCSGSAATAGDLLLGLDLGLAVVENEPGYKAFKRVSETTLYRGLVVSGLIAGTDVTLSLASPTTGEVVDGVYYGHVVVSANIPGRTTSELGVDLVELAGVREEQLSGVFYLGMPSDRETSFTCRILVPTDILVSTPFTMKLWCELLSRASGTTPTMDVEAAVLPKPDGCTELTFSNYPFSSIGSLGVCTFSASGKMVTVETPSLSVAAGDTVYLRITRPGYGQAGDSYNGDLGILRMGATVES